MPPEIERFVRERDVRPTCECQSRRCGPHRCWPSIWLGSGFLGAILWLIVIYSFHAEELHGIYGKWQDEWNATAQHDLEVTTAKLVASTARAHQEFLGQLAQERRAFAESVERAQSVIWVTLTPEAERAIELRQALRKLETVPHE